MKLSRLGAMLYLDIREKKEAMKVLDYQQDIGGMAACIKIIVKATKS